MQPRATRARRQADTPDGVALQEIGPIIAPPTGESDGAPVSGDVLDAR